ncbi:MAG: hypothetical protein IPM88_06205 [Nitrospira sp.]|nr:hypothetical protein [Nitrospira sp.]
MVTHRVWDEWAVGQGGGCQDPGLAVPMQPWLEGLATYDVIYLGEEHHNRSHIDAGGGASLAEPGASSVAADGKMFGWDD